MTNCIREMSAETNNLISSTLAECIVTLMQFLQEQDICAHCGFILIQTSLQEAFKQVTDIDAETTIRLVMLATEQVFKGTAVVGAVTSGEQLEQLRDLLTSGEQLEQLRNLLVAAKDRKNGEPH